MSAGLNIAALARRTGVAPDTLRKWEQRYQILRPTRTAGGQRRYSERDVARVEWLCERLSEGYRIGEAASLLGTADVAPTRSPQDQLQAMLDAVEAGEPGRVGLLVDQALALHGVDATFDQILVPLLRTVGERWQHRELAVGDEHLVTEMVRSRLGHLLADAGSGGHGTAVLACAPGEQHELGLMMVAIRLRRDGWRVVYLGANTPLADAVSVAQRQDARVLGISVTTAQNLAALDKASGTDGVKVVLGGAAASASAAKRLGAVYAGDDLAETVATVRAYAA
jgi:MerR family transcriptional regulator, light-induced transcriptional regulator